MTVNANETKWVRRETNLVQCPMFQCLYLAPQANELEGGQDSFRHEATTNLLLGVILGPDKLLIARL